MRTFKVVPHIKAKPNAWSYSILVIVAFKLPIIVTKSMSLSDGMVVDIVGPFTIEQASFESQTSYIVVMFDSTTSMVNS